MDALTIEKAIVAGFDWGARTANVIAALWPERCTALVSVSGYLIGSPQANQMPLPPQASQVLLQRGDLAVFYSPATVAIIGIP